MPEPPTPPDERELLERALELPPAGRASFLRDACSDHALRERVERLLEAHERAAAFTGERAVLEVSAPAENIGTEIGPYRLVEKLGEGGMGVVYLAEQSEPIRREVALKVIKLGMDTSQVVARFEAERQALALMDHPSIARVFDAGATAEGRPYFVMELVRGVPITDHSDRERLDTRARLELFEEVCAAVQHAHQKGVIHRDLKPSNVLVTQAEVPLPKVIDFGIAKAVEREGEGSLLTIDSQVLGTPEYMSPEQAGATAGGVDTRTDVYSLGVLLYELLTGSRPFDMRFLQRGMLGEMLRHIAEVDPERPSTRVSTETDVSRAAAEARRARPAQLARQIKGDLDWIVLKAMEKDRGRRYESASALAADVRRYLEDKPVEAGPPSALYRAAKFARRNRAWVGAAGVAFVALAAGVGSLAWSLDNVRKERDDAWEARESEKRAKLDLARALDAEIAAKGVAEQALGEAEVARELAEDQRDQAREVTDFLTEMLSAANPDEQGYDVRVRNLLRQAEGKLAREFEGRPLVRARLAYTIGKAYEALGEYERSIALLEDALATYTEEQGEEHANTLLTLNSLAISQWREGLYDEAEATLNQGIERSTRVHGATHIRTLRMRGNQAMVAKARGRPDEAERIYLELLDEYGRTMGEDHPSRLNVLNNLVSHYINARNGPEAERLLDEVMGQLDAEELGNDPFYLGLLQYQARMHKWRGRHEEAEATYRRVLAGRRERLGPEHPKTLETMRELASFLRQRSRWNESQELFAETLSKMRVVLGGDHPSTLDTLRSYGLLLMNRSQLTEAQAQFEEVVATFTHLYGARHPKTIDATNLLAITHYNQGHYEEASRAWEAQLDAVLAERGKGHKDTIVPLINLGMVASDLGRLADAEGYYEQGLELCLAAYGPDNDWTLNTQNNFAILFHRQGRFMRSAELNRIVIDARERLLGPTHPDTLGSKLNLASSLMEMERLDEAYELLEEAHEQSVEVQGADHPRTLSLLHALAQVIWRIGDLAEAAELFEACAEGRTRALGAEHVETLQSRHMQAVVARDDDEPEEARDLLLEIVPAMESTLDPGHASLLTSLKVLAGLHRDLGEAEAFRALAERLRDAHLLRSAPNDADDGTLRAAAECLLDLGRSDDVEAALELARRLSRRSGALGPADAWLLARCLDAAGEREQGVQVLSDALERLDANDSRRGALLERLADWAEE